MIAPSAAASRSASSNTMNGALPPSSSEIFLIVGATCFISRRPTSVEPVNDSLRTVGFAHISPPIDGASPVMTLSTPGRESRAMRELGERERRIRRRLGRLDDDRAARGERRRDLARDHRAREVPRRDRRADADRLLDDDEAAIVARSSGSRRRRRASLPRRTTRRTRRRSSTSPFASASGLPCSVVRISARSSTFASIRSYHLRRIARSLLRGLAAPRRPCAVRRRRWRAASRPRRITGTVPIGQPVAGLTTGIGRAVIGVDPLAVDVALLAQQRRDP